ncbi:hypothetical protein, partial [Ideonella azotifigens]|uniref:hypothetical protein n=1 Tax=Ideonella azotifigens TaxID=513160 RepID=UPI001B87D35A
MKHALIVKIGASRRCQDSAAGYQESIKTPFAAPGQAGSVNSFHTSAGVRLRASARRNTPSPQR